MPRHLPIIALLLAAPIARADGILIGRNGANRLIPVLEFTGTLEVPRSVFPGFPGHSQPYPGIGSLTISTPALNQFVMLPSANIELLVVSIDPDLRIQNDTGSGFLAAGQTYHLGSPFFDYHPLWTIPPRAVPYGPAPVHSATFVIRDRNNIYTSSAPFTVSLTPAPCPTDFTLDGVTTTADLVHFLARFSLSVTPDQPGSECDLNTDGTVNTPDLVMLLAGFAAVCT